MNTAYTHLRSATPPHLRTFLTASHNESGSKILRHVLVVVVVVVVVRDYASAVLNGLR